MSISPPPSVVPAPSPAPCIKLPLPLVSKHAPVKPRGPSPTNTTMKPPVKHFTSAEREAEAAAQAAMHQRIHLLPNQKELKDTIGVSVAPKEKSSKMV